LGLAAEFRGPIWRIVSESVLAGHHETYWPTASPPNFWIVMAVFPCLGHYVVVP
jgi:hypothetical protein